MTEPPARERRPPGVPLERSFAPTSAASHDERTRVLTPPLDVGQARGLVEAFFEAVRSENLRALEDLLAADATQQSNAGRELRGAREYWERRLARLDYEALPEGALFREQDIEIRRAEDDAPADRPASDAEGASSGGAELALGVPLLITHAGTTRLFGPRLTFVFVERAGRLQIARILEDFQVL
jgi:hypothetical protein